MDTYTFTQEIAVVSNALQQASTLVMHHYTHGTHVSYKQGNDPVTQADKDANTLIVETLERAFPQDGILAEESPDDPQRLTRTRLWCIDPIDGTRDFIQHTGDFIMMVGLAINGVASLGIMLHPPSQQLFVGYGHTAYILHNSTQTPLATSHRTRLSQATCMLSRSHPSAMIKKLTQHLGIPHCIQRGSVGLKMAALATAEAELYLSASTQIKEWDTCAPEAILKASGGTVTDLCGNPLRYNKHSPHSPQGILATNTHIHPMCVEALEGVCLQKGWSKHPTKSD